MLNKLLRLSRKYTNRSKDSVLEETLKSHGYIPIGETSDQDVFIIGFPKSGNTWMQHLITGIHFRSDMSVVQNVLVRELTPDEHQAKFYRRFDDQMFFKSHNLPTPRYKKVIYLVRDGRDAIVSFYKMQDGMRRNVSLNDIVKKNKGLPCSWNEHVQSWLKNPYNAEIIYVKYEDLKEMPFDTLLSVCNFLKISIADELLRQIITNCSFEKMRKKEESIYWGKSKEWEKDRFFVRKGQSGTYSGDLNGELLTYFEQESLQTLRRFNYK